VFDRATDALTGQVLERAGLEDRIDLLGHRRQRGGIAARLQPVADGFGSSHDLVGCGLGRLNHRLQLDAAVERAGHRRRHHVGDLVVDARQLGRQVRLAVVHQLNRGVDLHAQLGDAAIDEPAEVVELRADACANELFEVGGHGAI